MATKQRQLESPLLYLSEQVRDGKYGRDAEINVEAFREDLEEMLEDIEGVLDRLTSKTDGT